MSDPPERRPRSSFDIDMGALVAESGADYEIIGMAPMLCPYCGSHRPALATAARPTS
jgi:hypothetical protein